MNRKLETWKNFILPDSSYDVESVLLFKIDSAEQ